MTNKPQEQPPGDQKPSDFPASPPPPAVGQPGKDRGGPESKDPRLDQMQLISAILFEVDRQGVKKVNHDELNAVRIAADTVVAAVGRKRGGYREREGER